MEKNDLDAVKLLADWSKCLASLQTALLTLIGYLTTSGRVSIAGTNLPSLAVLGVVFLLGSLFCASFILYALPGIAQRLPPPEGEDILMMGTLNGGGTKLFVFSTAQFVLFALGAIFLVAWAIVFTSGLF